MKNVNGYNVLQIVLHWLNAVMILIVLLPVSRVGLLVPASEASVATPMTLHVWVGLGVLPVVVARLAARAWYGVPTPEALEPALLCGGGRLAHQGMYTLMLILPLSGASHWYFGVHVGHLVHEIARVLLTAIVGLHVSAALTHHFVFRNDALLRICWPWQDDTRLGHRVPPVDGEGRSTSP
jgi:cytochrome b561